MFHDEKELGIFIMVPLKEYASSAAVESRLSYIIEAFDDCF